jgi:hypothetical protein
MRSTRRSPCARALPTKPHRSRTARAISCCPIATASSSPPAHLSSTPISSHPRRWIFAPVLPGWDVLHRQCGPQRRYHPLQRGDARGSRSAQRQIGAVDRSVRCRYEIQVLRTPTAVLMESGERPSRTRRHGGRRNLCGASSFLFAAPAMACGGPLPRADGRQAVCKRLSWRVAYWETAASIRGLGYGKRNGRRCQ